MEPTDCSWIVVDEREGVGRVDTWSEYLCVCRTDDPEQIEIAICRYELVGEIPSEWFDDDGRPLVEYSDGEGNLLIPEYYEQGGFYTKLTGHDGEYLLGELAVDESIGWIGKANLSNPGGISEALEGLDWKTANFDTLVASIERAMVADA